MLRVNSVVLPMRADEANVDDSIRIVDPDYDAIFISRYIEHSTTVLENAGGPEIALDIRRTCPIRLPDLPIPSHKWLARVSISGTPIEERLERAQRDDPHAATLT